MAQTRLHFRQMLPDLHDTCCRHPGKIVDTFSPFLDELAGVAIERFIVEAELYSVVSYQYFSSGS